MLNSCVYLCVRRSEKSVWYINQFTTLNTASSNICNLQVLCIQRHVSVSARVPVINVQGMYNSVLYIFMVRSKDVIVLEPHPQHTLLASFGEDTAVTEEDIANTHMWYEV